MTSFVLNVRAEQYDESRSALRMRKATLGAALEAAGHQVLLFASRDEGGSSYYGTALLGEPVLDVDNPAIYWLPLSTAETDPTGNGRGAARYRHSGHAIPHFFAADPSGGK